MKKILFAFCLLTSLFANANIKSLDIYKNRNFVNQQLDLSKKSVDLLGNVRIEDIKFKLDENCSVNDFSIENKTFENDTLSKKIDELKEIISFKENSIKSLKSNISFLEKTSLTSLSNVNSLKETSTFIKVEVLSNYNEIYKLENSIKDDKVELSLLLQKRASNSYSILNYDIDCSTSAIVSYPFYNLSKNGFYDINYNSKNKKIEIKNTSFITQSTGTDFKNIDINLYSFNYTNQIKPYTFVPEYLDVKKNMLSVQSGAIREKVAMDNASVKLFKSKSLPSFEYVEDTTKSIFRAKNITLISGKRNEVVFSKDSFDAQSYIEIDGYSSSQAFYKVTFKSDKLFGTSNSKLNLDGSYVGNINLKEIKKDKETSIYFSTNGFIDIKKELQKDMKEEPFFSMNKLKTQKVWKYEIVNNSKNKQKFVLLDRVPVSKHEDIKVKLIGKTKESKLDKNGKIFFNFELKPKEKKIIDFGYEIEQPNK